MGKKVYIWAEAEEVIAVTPSAQWRFFTAIKVDRDILLNGLSMSEWETQLQAIKGD